MPDTPLNASEILSYLSEVADALAPTGPQHSIVVVGGSLLALRGLRQSTLDVDTLARIDPDLADAVAAVARLHDLAPNWLNGASAPFRPQTFVQADCDVLLDHARLLVLGAPLRQVFVMKLFPARSLRWWWRSRSRSSLVGGRWCGAIRTEESARSSAAMCAQTFLITTRCGTYAAMRPQTSRLASE